MNLPRYEFQSISVATPEGAKSEYGKIMEDDEEGHKTDEDVDKAKPDVVDAAVIVDQEAEDDSPLKGKKSARLTPKGAKASKKNTNSMIDLNKLREVGKHSDQEGTDERQPPAEEED